MEFLENYPEMKKKAQRILTAVEKKIEKLRKVDISSYLQKIENAPNLKSKSEELRKIMEENIPAAICLLEKLLETSKYDNKLEHLEWTSHRLHAAMSLESFSQARTIAEGAYKIAKEYYQSGEHNNTNARICLVPLKPTYKTFIKACFDLIYVCRYQGEIDDAEMYLEEAKAVAASEEEFCDLNHLLILHGDLLLARGQLNNAIEIAFDIVNRKRSVNTEKIPERVERGLLYQKLGNAYRSAAQWGLAKKYLSESIQIAKDQGHKISQYDGFADLGNVYRSEGRILDAIGHHNSYMTFAYKRGDLWRFAVGCYNIEYVFFSATPKPKLQSALTVLCAAQELAVRTGNKPLNGMALNKIGRVFCGMSKYEMALTVLNQSADIAKETGNLAGEGKAYGNIGTACRSMGKLDDAIKHHKMYLLNASGRGDDGGCAVMQREIAIDYLCKEDFSNAEKHFRDALATLENIRNKIGGDDASKIANFDKNQAETYCLLQVALARQGKHAEALALSELARSRALTDIIRDKIIEITGITTPSWIYSSNFVSRWQDVTEEILADFYKYADELKTNFLIYSVLKDYDSGGKTQSWLYIWVVLNKTASKDHERIHFRRISLNEKINSYSLSGERFFSKLKRHFRSLASDGLPSQSEINDFVEHAEEKLPQEKQHEAIPMDSSILELENLFDFSKVVSPVDTKNENMEYKELATDIDYRMNAIPGSTETEDQENELEERMRKHGSWKNEGIKELLELYEVCITPIDECLPVKKEDEVPNLTIIPHEFLFGVPFCCLHNGKNEYLIERFVLNYAPSFRALLLLHQRLRYLKKRQQNKEMKILAVGDPTMYLSGICGLPSSGNEARNIQNIFGDTVCQAAVRSDATKQFFLRELKNTDILHVATHACPKNFNNDNTTGDYGMQGCLLLASSDGKDCNGVVDASEISSKYCISQLVMLSCCETGLGKVTGDGVVGLYRAFFAAGAASVVVTLWKIGDNVTSIFMDNFYQKFKETGNARASLRSAMLYCIEQKMPPQQWAAFSLIGALT